jgi:hypothetical protein
MLKRTSQELAKRLGHNDFKATDGRLSSRKCWFGTRFNKALGETGSAHAISAKQWKPTKLQNLLQKFCTDNIYNADETGLFHRAMPDDSLRYKHEIVSGSKKATVHVTLLCCSNISGTDKWQLLVTEIRAKPWCFKGISMNSLPILYHANKNAWMIPEIFKKWLMSWTWNYIGNQGKYYWF